MARRPPCPNRGSCMPQTHRPGCSGTAPPCPNPSDVGAWGKLGRVGAWRMWGHAASACWGMSHGAWGMDDVGAGRRMAHVGAWGCMCWRPSCPKLTFHASLIPPPPTTCRSRRGANGKACTTTSPSTHRSSSALISGTVGRLFMHDCAVSWT